MSATEPSLTALLVAAQGGDQTAAEAASRIVYGELHQLATAYLGRERADHTLPPTALVSEAYLRLLGQEATWQNRGHFFGVAAQMMRRILVDHARRQQAGRRDRARTVGLDEALDAAVDATASHTAQDVLDVHEALEALERMDARQARVVELKFFVGLSIDQIAETLDISHATVSRDWSLARRWLAHRLRQA